MNNIPFVFFGTPPLSCIVLDELKAKGYMPTLVVTAPDRPQGRGLHVMPPAVKLWAIENNIPFLQPEKLDSEFYFQLSAFNFQLAILVAYGKILPQTLIESFPKGILNIHPSLLPKYRGPAPVEGSILGGDTETGVTIMLIDDKMDHGPILAQERMPVAPTATAPQLEKILFQKGGELLSNILPKWLDNTLAPQEQIHDQATYVKKLKKEDGLINLSDDPIMLDRKWRAYQPWPGLYFFHKKDGEKIRIKITDAVLEDGEFKIKKVIPEGKKEIPFNLL